MCVVSMITDHYVDKWPMRPTPSPYPPNLPWFPNSNLPDPKANEDATEKLRLILTGGQQALPTAAEIEAFRKDMAEFKVLLERAREYDKRNNEPHCELDSKKAAIKAIADHFGVDISFVDEPGAS